YPGRTMKRNLGVGQDEARHPGLVDQGELASNPAPCVIPDQCIRIDAELPQHSLERPGLSLRRIVVAGVAVRLSHSDQVRCVAGEAISKVHDDAVPRVTRQGEAVQEDYRKSASVPSPVNGGFSDLGDSFDANACIA